ncbi:MAG: FliI/YscN family ATPase [Acidimicrobiales bacterium]
MTLAPELLEDVKRAATPRRIGRVRQFVGLTIEVEGIQGAIGDAVRVWREGGFVDAEVVAIHGSSLACLPYGEPRGVRYDAPVEALGRSFTVPVGTELLGRVLDGLGNPIDGGPSIDGIERATIDGTPPRPLERRLIDRQLGLGVRAVDTLVPCGRGQRLGIFAGSGVGKSSLLSMIVRGTEADVSVLALVGERGREVREFVEHDLGPEGLARSVVVVATSDEPALVRIRAAFAATRIAEWFRDQGRDVVLMMDSLTRFAMAQREVGLAAGEPPATRGYPPSVFSLLPRLLERAGVADRGSITGLYTVLVEGDDMNEPVADASRAVLDGHIVLSRRLATAGHFPSIEVLESISRLEPAIVPQERRRLARELRRMLSAYRDARDLVEVGAYAKGSNPVVDRALELMEPMEEYLCQDLLDTSDTEGAWDRLSALLEDGSGPGVTRRSQGIDQGATR